MADAHKNFATSLVATAPSPATSGTSLVVTAADGAKFPTAPFNATVWPVGVQPTTANAEIVRVTAVSTDTFTIVRTQEGTSARTVIVGDQISANITAKTLTDAENPITGVSGGTLAVSTDYIAIDVLEISATDSLEIPATSTLEILTFIPINRANDLLSGWIAASGTWTYVSSTSMTVPVADALNMAIGTKLRLFNNGVLCYFYITAIAGSLITLTGGTDFTLANAAITMPFYSNDSSSAGFPQYFNYTPTITAGSGTFTVTAATLRFNMVGKMLNFYTNITITTVGTASGAVIFTLPINQTALLGTQNLGMGREDAVSGKMISCKTNAVGSASSSNYDNTSWIAAGSIGRISGSYEVA